jgi:hypothetical protein
MSVTTLGRIALAALVFAALDFSTVGFLYIVDPAGEAAASTITAAEAAGLTNLRVGFGAFHLAIGVIAAYCAIRRDRIWVGLRIVVTVTLIAVAVRLLGLAVDGVHDRTLLLLQFESLGLAIFVLGLSAEWRRQRLVR